MTDVKYPEHVHLAWRGALKACGVSAADVDAISEVVRSMLAENDASATCEVCGGSGEYFAHADDCNDNFCALNGDAHSCTGQVVRCDCSNRDCQYAKDVGMWPEHRCAVKFQYADATCALRGADEARQFPDNTCPASRHAQMIGEALVKGEAFPQLSEEPEHCGQSILATVEALYKARTALRGAQKESGWLPISDAPKDGRALLFGWFNSHGKWRTTRGCWFSRAHMDEYFEDPDTQSPGWFETTVEDEDGQCWPIKPSHFQFLPSPPTPEGEAK